MSILVINCNHWIGYHIVDALLDHDYSVDGIESDSGQDELSMFFGRNSAFSFYNKDDRKQYDACICVGDYEQVNTIHSDRIILINPQKSFDRINMNNITSIIASHLYGEWMPMTEKGFYQNEEFIAFQSKDFEKNAIHIEDFANGLIQWLQSDYLPADLIVKSEHHKQEENSNEVYIRSALPLKQRITALQKQYELVRRKRF